VKRFRGSFTVLSAWASGDYNKAIRYYFHLETYVSPAMLMGREFHKEWQEETTKTGCLPLVFGGKKLIKPVCEGKIEVKVEDWLDLVFVCDCRDNDTLYEYKTGKSMNSEMYANSFQTGLYALGHLYNKNNINRIEIHHYDQYVKKADMSIVWVTDKLLENSLNWLITQSSEMYDYLLKNNLYEKFSH
jgi:hypothetical protein